MAEGISPAVLAYAELLQRFGPGGMRNILAYVPQKEKKAFAAVLKEIWLAPTAYLMEYVEDWSVSRVYLSRESIEATLLTAA